MNIREPRDFRDVRNQRRAKHVLHRARKITIVVLIVLLSVVLLGYASYARALPLITAQTTLPAIETAEPALTWPAQGQASIGVLGQGVMASTTGQKPAPTASTTKVMVAHMVLKKYPLEPGQQGQTFTITAKDVQAYNNYIAREGSALRVEAGQQITQRQALEALLVSSANNIADMLAAWAYGSLPAYFEAANAEASALGMTQTTFAGDAGGLSPKTTSTAYDLAVLGQAVMQNPVIREIVVKKTATLPLIGGVSNTNILLGQNGIIGIKTGHTDEAGGAYIFAAEHTLPNGKPIIAVGAIVAAPSLPDAMAATTPLLNSFYQGFGPIAIAQQGQVVAEYSVPWGATVSAAAAQNISVLGWKGSRPTVTVTTQPLDSLAEPGVQAGTITAGTPYDEASAPITLSTAISKPSWQWRTLRL